MSDVVQEEENEERQLVTEEGNKDEAEFLVSIIEGGRKVLRNGIGLAETMLHIGHLMDRSYQATNFSFAANYYIISYPSIRF